MRTRLARRARGVSRCAGGRSDTPKTTIINRRSEQVLDQQWVMKGDLRIRKGQWFFNSKSYPDVGYGNATNRPFGNPRQIAANCDMPASSRQAHDPAPAG